MTASVFYMPRGKKEWITSQNSHSCCSLRQSCQSRHVGCFPQRQSPLILLFFSLSLEIPDDQGFVVRSPDADTVEPQYTLVNTTTDYETMSAKQFNDHTKDSGSTRSGTWIVITPHNNGSLYGPPNQEWIRARIKSQDAS